MTQPRTFDELFEPQTWHLRLERESEKHWVVLDAANPDHPMLRTPDCDTAIRFMRAFVAKEPGAVMQDHAETHYSWRVAQEATRPNNVLPFPKMHEQVDEVGA